MSNLNARFNHASLTHEPSADGTLTDGVDATRRRRRSTSGTPGSPGQLRGSLAGLADLSPVPGAWPGTEHQYLEGPNFQASAAPSAAPVSDTAAIAAANRRVVSLVGQANITAETYDERRGVARQRIHQLGLRSTDDALLVFEALSERQDKFDFVTFQAYAVELATYRKEEWAAWFDRVVGPMIQTALMGSNLLTLTVMPSVQIPQIVSAALDRAAARWINEAAFDAPAQGRAEGGAQRLGLDTASRFVDLAISEILDSFAVTQPIRDGARAMLDRARDALFPRRNAGQ